jgi:hypothetical protein
VKRRRKLFAGMAGVLVVAGAGTGVTMLGGGGEDAAAEDDGTPTVSTATVQRTDLVENEELDGTLGYGDATELAVSKQGTITALPEVGTIIERGGTVAEVNGVAVTLLYGSKPVWRPFEVGMTDGPDVQILEENLVAMGHATAANLEVDQEFTSATAAAIKRWQKAQGFLESGVLDTSDVVVQPGAVRVSARTGQIGGNSGGPVLSVSPTDRRVTLDVEADRQGLFAVGDPVQVELPDGSVVDASVTSVATVITPGDPQLGTGATFEVVVSLADPAAAGSFDAAPVDVLVSKEQATGVLAVPVSALLALAEGGYALERVTGTSTELVAVEVGAFAIGMVEVSGDIAEGDEVVVPA